MKLQKLDKNKTYLIHVRGHVGVITDSTWYDNKYSDGMPFVAVKIKPLGIYEVIKL